MRRFKAGGHRRTSGYATVVVLALLGLMVFFLMSSSRALTQLKRELRLLERHQVERITPGATSTNRAPPQTALVRTNLLVHEP